MAMGKARTRARSSRRGIGRGRTRRTALSEGLDANVVSRVVVGAVNGVEIVVVNALRITRDVLVRTISGAADIGAEALTVTSAGVRGIVAAASRMVGDIVGAAQSTVRETRGNVTRARPSAHVARAEPFAGAADGKAAAMPTAGVTRHPRGRARGARPASRGTRGSVAA